MKIKLAKTELIHFVGIGGIGMSGLALIMKGKGFKVQGSDIANNKNIERLRKEKIKVLIGHKKQNIENGTILVVSSAIKKNNPEFLAAARNSGLFFLIAEDTTRIVPFSMFCFLCPIKTFIFSFLNLSIFLLFAISLP